MEKPGQFYIIFSLRAAHRGRTLTISNVCAGLGLPTCRLLETPGCKHTGRRPLRSSQDDQRQSVTATPYQAMVFRLQDA